MSQDKYPLKVVYTGRRLIENKIYHRFEKPNGEAMHFRGVKRVWIGYTYKCGENNISSKPERTEDERIDNPEWDVADELVDAELKRKKAEKILEGKQSPALKNAIAALAPLCRNISYFQRRTLIEYLCEQSMKFKKGK